MIRSKILFLLSFRPEFEREKKLAAKFNNNAQVVYYTFYYIHIIIMKILFFI
jgi:hypothetical protein